MARLTERQSQIYELIQQGLSPGAIAAELGVTAQTVYTYKHRLRGRLNPEHLTPREREVAELMRTGLRPVQIAEKLGISPRTAEHHRDCLFNKFGATNSAHLVSLLDQQELTALRAEIAELQGRISNLEAQLANKVCG